jgi:hypothetical protein
MARVRESHGYDITYRVFTVAGYMYFAGRRIRTESGDVTDDASYSDSRCPKYGDWLILVSEKRGPAPGSRTRAGPGRVHVWAFSLRADAGAVLPLPSQARRGTRLNIVVWQHSIVVAGPIAKSKKSIRLLSRPETRGVSAPSPCASRDVHEDCPRHWHRQAMSAHHPREHEREQEQEYRHEHKHHVALVESREAHTAPYATTF